MALKELIFLRLCNNVVIDALGQGLVSIEMLPYQYGQPHVKGVAHTDKIR